MKRLVDRSAGGLRLIPPGKNRLPWFASSKKYPWMGHSVFYDEMTEEERDKLYEVYQTGGLGALHDAVKFLDDSVWIQRYRTKSLLSTIRGHDLMEGR